MTKTSAISMRPALLACAVTPARVDDDHSRVGLPGHLDLDLADADGLHDDPRLAHGVQRADGLRHGGAKPPRWPRVAIERMNTSGSVAWSCMRTLSPRMAPPLKGDVGSMARTPTAWPCARR
jgi:hypothetical protein